MEGHSFSLATSLVSVKFLRVWINEKGLGPVYNVCVFADMGSVTHTSPSQNTALVPAVPCAKMLSVLTSPPLKYKPEEAPWLLILMSPALWGPRYTTRLQMLNCVEKYNAVVCIKLHALKCIASFYFIWVLQPLAFKLQF